MKNDETFLINGDSGTEQLQSLERVLAKIVDTLEKGRCDIFDISQDCQKQTEQLETELEQLKIEILRTIDDIEKNERLERSARIRLMEVSRDFARYKEKDVKEAYDNARIFQVVLVDLHQKEKYLAKRRDEIGRFIKRFKSIVKKADEFLNNTGLALRLLQGNVTKISETIEEAHRKQQMAMWIVDSQESERRKIARELHDGPAQSMASMLIRLDLIERLFEDDKEEFFEQLIKAKAMGQESLADIRRIMFDLRPTLIHEDGFGATIQDYLQSYEAKYNFNIDFIIFGERRKYDLSLEIALFRLVQEAITNARKHSGADRAMVKIEDNSRFLTLVIKDEGVGFDLDNIRNNHESYGIVGMKERVELFGGQIDIVSSPGSGTQVIIKVPLDKEAIYGYGKDLNSG